MARKAPTVTYSANGQAMSDCEETCTMINVASDTNVNCASQSSHSPVKRGRSVVSQKRQSGRMSSKSFKVMLGIVALVVVAIVVIFYFFGPRHGQNSEEPHLQTTGIYRQQYDEPYSKSTIVPTQHHEATHIETATIYRQYHKKLGLLTTETYSQGYDDLLHETTQMPFSETRSVDIEKINPSELAKKIPNEQKYCSTWFCRGVADSIAEDMDMNADPCTDFYQYACGGWIRRNPLLHGVTMIDNFVLLSLKNTFKLRSLLELYSMSKNKAEDKARIYYASCLDKNGDVEELGSKPVLALLNEIGGWSISGKFDINKWDFQKTLAALYNLPTRALPFTWTVGVDIKESSKNVIQLGPASLGLREKQNYLKGDITLLRVFLGYMTRVGVLLGGEEKDVKDKMLDVIMLELKLARIIPDVTEDVELLYNKMPLSDLMKMAPAINWLQYFNFAFKDANREISPSDEIVVTSPRFVRQMSQLIEEYLSTTQGRTTLNSYLGWSMVLGLIPYLPKSFQIDAKTSSDDEVPWYSCFQKTEYGMGVALGAMFVKDTFKSENKQTVKQMINDMRAAFKQNLPSLKWLDDETRRLIKEKIDAIAVDVGYSDFIMDPEKLDKYYETLELKENEFLENTVRIHKFFVLKNTRKLGEPVDRFEWIDLMPHTVNARTSFLKNQIAFPAGILQEPFYKANYPKFLSFGKLGFLIGHELMHTVDNRGRLFDKTGNYYSWWKYSTIENFESKAQCFVNQYSRYRENNIYLNGSLTLPDNIADNGGLKIAFNAYENWMKSHEAELPLFHRSLKQLSPRKLFFVGFAQMWCSASTPERMKQIISESKHSPHKFRVIGTLENSDDFQREFHCPRTAFQNSRKCKLW